MKLVSSKINVLKIFNNHLSTFGDVDKRNRFCDYLTFYIFPILVMQLTQPDTRCRICLHERQGVSRYVR